MGEILRRAEQRELVVSTGHLTAAGAAAVVLTLTAFGVGFGLGRSSVPPVVHAEAPSFLGTVPGEDLVQLLAEVERGRVAHTSSAVRYPDWIDGSGELGIPAAAEAATGVAVAASVGVPAGFTSPASDAPPPGAYAVEAGELATPDEAAALRDVLRAQGLAAWSGPRQVDGVTRFVVRVGGFGSEAEATAALGAVRAAGAGSTEGAQVVGVGVRPAPASPPAAEAAAVPPVTAPGSAEAVPSTP
jgi:hypothetical protein